MSGRGIVDVLVSRVDEKPFAAVEVGTVLPAGDDPSEVTEGTLGRLDGQTFVIEYVDTKGSASVRRISVYSVEAGSGGMPCLYARCHERKAMRQFRVDRIRSCADFDGVVYPDVLKFLSDTFGMAMSDAVAASSGHQRWSSVLHAIRAEAVLLSCVSLADGSRHDRETESMADYLSRIAEDAVGIMTDAEIVAMVRYVQRLRPGPEAITAAVEAMRRKESGHQRRFFSACVDVMDADGFRRSSEKAMIDDLCAEIVGVRMPFEH